MSKLETNQVDPATGTTLTLGTSGDTISIPSGVAIANSGTATGFGGANTPYFQGRLNANQSVSNGSGTIIQLTAAIDTASGWDSSTYKWTVPSGQGGNYFVSVVVDGQSSTSNNTSWVNCTILKNSDVAIVASENKSMTSNAGGRHVMTNSCSGIVALSAGDEVYFQATVYINSGTAQFNGSSSIIVTGGTIFKLIGS